ncbi:MAG TPA: hypothetical protein PLR99_03065 [Polyangiaceae bacterium]|nr:hypothetical protein [Polyangiaceae bacterium]
MHLEASLLRAIARLSRQGRRATLDELELRVSGEPEALLDALRRLRAASLVTAHGAEVRLTLAGLAVAVSTAAARREPRAATRRGKKLRAA